MKTLIHDTKCNHTPGPWRVLEQREGFPPYNRTVVHGQTNGTVAVRMTVADARLIAAAPEMLALLKASRTAEAHKTSQELGREFYCWCDASSLDDLHENEHAPICQTARALLARIEGRD